MITTLLGCESRMSASRIHSQTGSYVCLLFAHAHWVGVNYPIIQLIAADLLTSVTSNTLLASIGCDV